MVRAISSWIVEGVLELAVVALRPERAPFGDAGELGRDPEPVARAADGALEHRGDAEPRAQMRAHPPAGP